MGYGKFGLRLLGTKTLMIIVSLLIMPLMAVFPDNEIFQWLVGVIIILIFWLVMYADATNYGQSDVKRDNFYPVKGFLSGLIASIPDLILYAAVMALPNIEWMPYILYGWLAPYIKIVISYKPYMPAAAILLILVFPVLTGLSYLDGPRRRKKVLETIEKRKALQKELSKR